MESEAIDWPAYLERIGHVGPLEPTLPLLTRLVACHMASIPFESVDVMLGRGVDLSPATVDRKMLDEHRGGYCFEHASLMRRALQTLGYRVHQHLARVWIGADPAVDPPSPATHTSLKVEVDDMLWLVDVGFGGFTPNQPLAWRFDVPQSTAFGTYRLAETAAGAMLEMQRGCRWLPLYEIMAFDWQPADFRVANHYTATHPESRFRNELVAALTTPHGRTTLVNNHFKQVARDGLRTQRQLDAGGIAEVMETSFGLSVEPDWWPMLERVSAPP